MAAQVDLRCILSNECRAFESNSRMFSNMSRGTIYHQSDDCVLVRVTAKEDSKNNDEMESFLTVKM